MPGGGGLTDTGLEEVKKLPALKGLVLDATQVTDAGMASLLPVSALESLSLSGTRVSAAGLSQLAALPKLTRLEMSSCDLTLEDCAAIGKLPVLEVLVLDHAPEVADALLEQICEASSLKSLNLDNCVGITDRGLLALAKIKGLEELKINKASITGAGFAAVLAKGGLKHLRALEVSGSPINQVGAKAINSMKTLETLNISSIMGMNDLFFGEFVEGLKNLKHLSVAMSPGLLGQGFVKLKSAVNSLETIDAHNSGIHDPIFEALKGHKKLKALNLDHSQVSLPGIQQFKKWTPGCEIQFGEQKY